MKNNDAANICAKANSTLTFNIEPAEAGNNVVLPIEFVNPDEISAVQLPIVLPDGVSVALDDDASLWLSMMPAVG